MKPTKSGKLIYWTTTLIIFLLEGVMPALTSQTELAKEGIRHLGYPEFFGNALVVFKIAGSILLILPIIPARVKEWAYAGFAFDFIFAAISHWAVEGFNGQALFPMLVLLILMISYSCYHKIRKQKLQGNINLRTNDYALSGI
jgi:uncharacterized membrane protein YphA (DoxX/SURF4 family)